ncbi:hypothetical protein EV421DRAFT_1846482 [Armillaria borealis]|uniref:Uncharacterized protein n=1 Tax=Armillaria borealis TaxID=47425 RepID=A0AA39J0B8_9AGAR|nr:hypothetical protein EV421DRAFT_1846482 [Armillaria borealis]
MEMSFIHRHMLIILDLHRTLLYSTTISASSKPIHCGPPFIQMLLYGPVHVSGGSIASSWPKLSGYHLMDLVITPDLDLLSSSCFSSPSVLIHPSCKSPHHSLMQPSPGNSVNHIHPRNVILRRPRPQHCKKYSEVALSDLKNEPKIERIWRGLLTSAAGGCILNSGWRTWSYAVIMETGLSVDPVDHHRVARESSLHCIQPDTRIINVYGLRFGWLGWESCSEELVLRFFGCVIQI